MYTTFLPGAYGSQKKTWDPLKVELQTIVSHHIGGWKSNLASQKAANTLNH